MGLWSSENLADCALGVACSMLLAGGLNAPTWVMLAMTCVVWALLGAAGIVACFSRRKHDR